MKDLLKSETSWQQDNIITIITWHQYCLLELYNLSHGGIYICIHIHTHTKTSVKHVPNIYQHQTKTALPQPTSNEGWSVCIWSAFSHVASSGPKCFHFTLASSIGLFLSMRFFCYNMHWRSGWNSPSWFTYNTDQSITWLTSFIYFLSNEISKTSWNFTMRGSGSWYFTGPILSRILKGPQYHGANLAHEPILKELFLGLMHKYTCSPT